MLTDVLPRNARAEYLKSDQIKTLDLATDSTLRELTTQMESAMKSGRITEVRTLCQEFLSVASAFYNVPRCTPTSKRHRDFCRPRANESRGRS